MSAALLAVPGASAYFLWAGAVVYTAAARSALLHIEAADMAGLRPSTEPYAALLARRVRERHGATWGLAETGATGPTGNRYGDCRTHLPRGHRAGRAHLHLADRIERARAQHGGVRGARARAAR